VAEVALQWEFLNNQRKASAMNNVFIPQPLTLQNPLADLLARMDSQDSLNQESAKLSVEMSALLKELVHEQRQQGELLAKIARWMELQPK
jgi:hypothetical protein